MLTRQEILNTAYLGLVKQGHRSCNMDTAMCVYRGPNGDKCAIGLLMTDEEYTPEMDDPFIGGDVTVLHEKGLLPNRFEKFVNEDDDNLSFLEAVQIAHDRWGWGYASEKNLKSRFSEVASFYNLTLAEVE